MSSPINVFFTVQDLIFSMITCYILLYKFKDDSKFILGICIYSLILHIVGLLAQIGKLTSNDNIVFKIVSYFYPEQIKTESNLLLKIIRHIFLHSDVLAYLILFYRIIMLLLKT